MVKQQTLIGAVILSLFVGFIGGTVYSSFKLSGSGQPAPQQNNTAQQNTGGQQAQTDTAEYAARILQIKQFLEQHPDDAQAWTQLGNLYFDSNQPQEAIGAYEKSLTLEPGRIGVITDLGVMYRRNNQPEKAIETFDKAISIDSTFETARFNKGVVLLHDLNDVEGGIKAWEELVEINPTAMAPNGESVDALVQRMKKQE